MHQWLSVSPSQRREGNEAEWRAEENGKKSGASSVLREKTCKLRNNQSHKSPIFTTGYKNTRTAMDHIGFLKVALLEVHSPGIFRLGLSQPLRVQKPSQAVSIWLSLQGFGWIPQAFEVPPKCVGSSPCRLSGKPPLFCTWKDCHAPLASKAPGRCSPGLLLALQSVSAPPIFLVTPRVQAWLSWSWHSSQKLG